MITSSKQQDQVAKRAILSCGARLYQRGLVAANDGNISVKVSEHEIWTTPTGVSKGFMTEDMLVKVDRNGEVLEGTLPPSTELAMHLRIYQEAANVGAVVHAHPPAATAFAVAGLPLDRPLLQEAVVQLGPVPIAPFAVPGTSSIADSVAPFCRSARAALLEFHGAVAWGSHLDQALHRLECMEQYATLALHLKTLGSTQEMPSSLVAALAPLHDKFRE